MALMVLVTVNFLVDALTSLSEIVTFRLPPVLTCTTPSSRHRSIAEFLLFPMTPMQSTTIPSYTPPSHPKGNA